MEQEFMKLQVFLMIWSEKGKILSHTLSTATSCKSSQMENILPPSLGALITICGIALAAG
jgi:hypothetical protein